MSKYRNALIRTEVPASLWLEIKNSIDYAIFETKVVLVIEEFYTNSELQDLINLYEEKPKIPITKLSFRDELHHEIGNFIQVDFLITVVNDKLTNNGYAPL